MLINKLIWADYDDHIEWDFYHPDDKTQEEFESDVKLMIPAQMIHCFQYLTSIFNETKTKMCGFKGIGKDSFLG